MSTQVAMEAWPAAGARPANRLPVGRVVTGLLTAVVIGGLLAAGWYVHQYVPYSSDSPLAYNLGLTGGILMLALLIYPLRKRYRWLNYLGPLRHWFRFHMIAGVMGPLLVMFHSTFQVHSFNAAIALWSMWLVVASGLVGRLLYRRIHRGLYGRRTSLKELQLALEQQLSDMQQASDLPQHIRVQVEQFAQLIALKPQGICQRVGHFMSLGFRRRLAAQRARRALGAYCRSGSHTPETVAHMAVLLRQVDATLKTAQAAAQFATFERLFSYWHAVHVPFLFMLLVTAVIHVVAVHAY